MTSSEKIKWYFRPISITIAILCMGPLALPLVWKSPALKGWVKVFLTLLIALLTAWTLVASVQLYNLLLKHLQELQAVLNLQ